MSRIALLPLSGRTAQGENCPSSSGEGEIHQIAACSVSGMRSRSGKSTNGFPLREASLDGGTPPDGLAAFAGAPRRRRRRRRRRTGRARRYRRAIRTGRHRWRRGRRRRRWRRTRRRDRDLRPVGTGLHCRRRRRPRCASRKNDRRREDKRKPHFPLLSTNCRQANESSAATFLRRETPTITAPEQGGAWCRQAPDSYSGPPRGQRDH